LLVFKSDGTWEDVVLGGSDEEERARMLEDLQRTFRTAH
jgi:hypothetical protein